MAGVKKGTWIAGTVVGALIIVLASWFLAINPAFSRAADVRAQAAQTRQQNDALTTKVAQLKADFAKLDQYKSELTGLRTQIPTTGQLSDYLRQLDAIAAAHTVTITTITPGTATVVVPAKAAAPAAAASPAATAAATGSATSGSAAATATTSAPNGMADIPLSLTVVGSYDNTLAFLNDLQTKTPRLFLVAGFTGTSQDSAAASGGRPKTALGDQQLQVNGFLYVVPDSGTSPTPTPSPSATPGLPAAVPGKDPLVPVGGGH